MEQIIVPSKYPGVLLVEIGDGPTLIQNSDALITIYLGDDNSVTVGNSQKNVPLSAQSFLVVDGSKEVWAIAASSNVIVNKIVGGLSFFQSGITAAEFILNTSGFFVYSAGPPPVANKLIASITPAAGTDGAGNQYLQAGTFYHFDGTTWFAVQIGGAGQIQFYNDTSELIFWTPIANIGTVGPDLQLASNRDIMSSEPFGLETASDPTTVTGRARLYASSTTGQMKYISDPTAGDGNIYNTGALRKWLTTNSGTINSTTPTPIAGLSGIPVVAQSYKVSGMIVVIQGGTTATQAIRLTGPTTSLFQIANSGWEGTTFLSSGVANAIGTSNMGSGAVPNGTTGELHFDGIVTFSAAGNLGIEALCVTSGSDTWVMGLGSYIEVCPIG